MMKKILFSAVLCFVLAGASLFAFDPATDLKKYPSAVPQGSFVLNGGIGVGVAAGGVVVPPISVSGDYALPISGLPFFVGGNIAAYFGADLFDLGIGARFGYHFNFDVPNLDTYAVLTLGFNMNWAEKFSPGFYPGLGIGGRYFFTPNLGAFLELGYINWGFFTAGVTFRL
jgi:hypothetical protein